MRGFRHRPRLPQARPRRLAWTDYRPAEPETWVRIPAGASPWGAAVVTTPTPSAKPACSCSHHARRQVWPTDWPGHRPRYPVEGHIDRKESIEGPGPGHHDLACGNGQSAHDPSRGGARNARGGDPVARRHTPRQGGGDHHRERLDAGVPRSLRPRNETRNRPEVGSRRSAGEKPQEQIGPDDPSDQVRDDERPTTDSFSFLVQQGIEVVHRGVAHEGNREEDHKSDPARLPDEGLQDLENPRP